LKQNRKELKALPVATIGKKNLSVPSNGDMSVGICGIGELFEKFT
jgi:hypothetical protein